LSSGVGSRFSRIGIIENTLIATCASKRRTSSQNREALNRSTTASVPPDSSADSMPSHSPAAWNNGSGQ
jgi:hypothetical protein